MGRDYSLYRVPGFFGTRLINTSGLQEVLSLHSDFEQKHLLQCLRGAPDRSGIEKQSQQSLRSVDRAAS
jgi:hypothetical protein